MSQSSHHTLASLVQRFPEVETAPSGLLASCLEAAAVEVDPNLWGTLTREGHGLITARKLALSPWGRDARIMADDGSTTYDGEITRLQLAVASSMAPRAVGVR